MSWNVDQVKKYYEFLINKNQTGSFSPTDLFNSFNSEQRAHMADLLGRWQAQNNGKTGPNTGLVQNESISTALAPFTKKATINTSVSGTITKPADLIYRLAMRANNKRVTFVNKGQIYSVLNNAIDPPSIADDIYYATEYDTVYTIWPGATPTVELDYVRDCVDVVWGFTADPTTGLPVYAPSTSTNPEWSNADIITIVKRSIKSLGLHFASPTMEAFGESAIKTGN